MRRSVLLLLLASCTEAEPPTYGEIPKWVYPPANPVWQLGEPKGRFGRGQPPQQARELGITGDAKVPLRDAMPWPVPGEPARAVVYGLEGTQPAIELIEVDSGKHLWRHGSACVEPVIGVTGSTIVCGGNKGVRGVSLDGKPTWSKDTPLIAITDTRVLVETGSELTVYDADTGDHVATVPKPAEVLRAGIAGACDGEILALTSDRLQKITRGPTKAVIAWTVPMTAKAAAPPPAAPVVARPRVPQRLPPRGAPAPAPPTPPAPSTIAIAKIACTAETILVETRALVGAQVVPSPAPRTLHAIARATGKLTGRIEALRGWWPARDGSTGIEVSAAGRVALWPGDLSEPIRGLAMPHLGELIDAHEDLRLVRATPLTAVVLDRQGVRAYVPLAASHAVIGETALIATTAEGAPDSTSRGGLRRFELPPPPSSITRVPPRRAGVALPAELRDLPAAHEPPGDRVIVKADTGKHAVPAIAIDPRDSTSLFAIAQEAAGASAIAHADLAARTWSWQRSDGCGDGIPVGLALANDIVACGAQGLEATVRATSRDGAAKWERTLDRLDAIVGGGDAVLAFDADRLTVLDAATGVIRGRLASGDGAVMRAALVAIPIPGTPIEDTTWLVTFERQHLVARLPEVSMVAVWSLAVDGVVASIQPSGAGVLVTLDDGDAYRIELPGGAVQPLPGLGLTWRAMGELVTGEAIGGPIPGIPGPPPVRLPVRPTFGKPPALGDRNPEAPDLWVPIPEPRPLGDSWQYTLFERAGAVRVRNDYALAAPITPTEVRGPTGSPLVIASGAEQRDILVVDPRTGDPLRRVVLPGPGLVFGTIVNGEPVAGTVLAAPLRIVLF